MSASHPNRTSLRNQKAKLAADYHDLLKELSATDSPTIGCYQLGKTIGEGTYGKVKLATHRLTGQNVAIKRIDRQHIPLITREIHHHRRLRHPNITALYEIILAEGCIHVVTEYCANGELFDVLTREGRLSEPRARRWFSQLVDAIKYCHSHRVVHRDLKLENILLDSQWNVKLCDFGFTRECETKKMLETFCGSLAYAAPEVIRRKKYSGPEADIWSLGIVLYTLLTAELPFDDDHEPTMQDKILHLDYEIPDYLTEESRHLIDGILRLDPNERLSIDCILNHAWFDLDFEEESGSDRSSVISPQTLCSPSNDSFVRVEQELEDITDSLRIQREDIQKIESERQRIISQISWGHDTTYSDDPRHSAPVPARNSASSFSSSYRLSSPSSLGVSPINSPTNWRMEMDDMSMSTRSSYTPMSHTEQRLMNALQTAGFDVESMQKNVRAGSCDASSAIWYMLLEKLGREEEEVKTQKMDYGSHRNSVNRLSYRLSSPLGSVMSMPKGRDSAAELRRLALTSSAQNGKHSTLQDTISNPVETCEMATQTTPSLDLPVRPVETTSRYDKPLPSPGSFKRVANSPSFDKKYTSSISSRTTTASNGWLSSVKSLFVRREASEPNLKSFLHDRQPWPRDLPELPDGFIAQHHQRSQTQPLAMSDKRLVQSPPIYRSTSFGSRQRSLQLVTPPISEVDQMNYAQVSPSPNRNIRNLSISLADHGGGNFNMPTRTTPVQSLPMPPQTPPRAALSADRADPEFAKRPIPSRLQTTPTALSTSMQLKSSSNHPADKFDACQSNSSQGTTMESPLMEYSSPSSSTMDSSSDASESSLSDDELPAAANKMHASKPIQIMPEPSYSAPLPLKSSFAMRWQSPQASSPFDLGAARSRLSAQNLSDSDIRNRMGRKVIVEEDEEDEE
ncbi:hypothetical protein BC943DRAFT_298491 [Umbelopsis sp. AD052]|nr:hypothetical protein BC943DRAFT_298491 [Umbelopsis sp. AD052]